MTMRVISADSHMMEPADLWEKGLDNKFRDRAPKVVKSESGKDRVRRYRVEGTSKAG